MRKSKHRPPVCKQIPHEIEQHGKVRNDPFAWLRNKSDAQVIAHLEKENDYVDKVMGHTQELQEKIYQEILSRTKETDMQVPYQKGPYLYYSRTEKGKNYPIFCRKGDAVPGEEEVVLDLNELAKGHDYLDLGAISVSPQHDLLAYAIDYEGSEEYTLLILNLSTRDLLPDRIEKTSGSIEWAEDNQTLFYLTMDDSRRPDRVFRHRLGDEISNDVEIFYEKDKAFYADVSKSKSNRYLFIESHSKVTTEVYYLPADEPDSDLHIIEPRRAGVEYSVYHQGENFLILTNDQAENFKVMSAPVESPGKAQWKTFLEHDEQRRVEYLESFKNYVAVFERKNGLRNARVVNMQNEGVHEIKFKEAAYVFGAEVNKEYDREILRIFYQSPLTPHSIYDYHLGTRERILLKQKEVPGGYQSEDYVLERLMATAKDGRQIPITLIRSKKFPKDSNAPAKLRGYGSYEIPSEPSFNPAIFSLVDRGVTLAVAHIRGGGELGRKWYEEGKLLKKKNTFTDFIACAEHLISQGYTSPGKIAIEGGSAGGLLVGAVTNMRPDLWGAVVALVPFVDVVNTMSDESLPLTVTEYDEWGSPQEKVFFDYMLSYSPYDNVVEQAYPPILATAGLNDPRVGFWEPAKWVARLREQTRGDHPVLLKTEMGTGHAGPSGRYKRMEEDAFTFSFVLDRLGVGTE